MKEQPQSPEDLPFGSGKGWYYLWGRLKNSIFDVLYVLLDNSEQQKSMLGLCFQTGVDYLQMMSFPFNSVILSVWSANQTLSEITNLMNYFNVSSLLPSVGFDTFLLMMYALILLIIFVICDIVYVAYSFSQKRFRFTWPLVFLARVVPIIVTILFLPIMQTLLLVVNCENVDDGSYQVLQSFPSVTCWEGWHLFHTTITLLFSFLFVCVSCVVTLANFQPRMTTNRLTARQNSTGEVVFIVNKIVCQFIFSFSPFQDTLPYCIMLFGLSAWLYWTYNMSQPYYSKKASKFFRIVSTYYFWTNFILLISNLLAGFGFQDGLVIWTNGIIFLGVTILFQRKSNIDTLFSSSLKFKSGLQLQSHLQYVLNLHHNRNQDKNSYMLLLGYIQKHIELCVEEDCPLKYNKSKFYTAKAEEQYSCKQLLKQIQRMFLQGIKKYPHCTKLQLTFAFFYMEKCDDSVKAYEYLTRALDTQPSFGEQFIIYRFRKIINEKSKQNKQNHESDLIQLIKFDNHVSLCQEGMLISDKLHRQFWLQLKQESPNLDRLNIIGSRIISTSQILSDNYQQIVRLSNDGISIIHMHFKYAMYLMLISHQTGLGKTLLKGLEKKLQAKRRKQNKQKKQKGKNQLAEIMDTQKALVVSELDFNENGSEPCCRIKKVNEQFLFLTNYKTDDLIDKRLDKILPKILEDDHDIMIHKWLENSESQKKPQKKQQEQKHELNCMEGRKIGYIKQSNSHIIKVLYKVHFISIQHKFLTQIERYPNSTHLQSIIICDSQGIIMQTNLAALYVTPKITDSLEIQTLINTQIVQRMKFQNNRTFSLQVVIQGNRFYDGKELKYKCKINKIVITKCEQQIENGYRKAMNSVDSQAMALLQRKNTDKVIGFVVSLIQKSQENSTFQSKFKRPKTYVLSNRFSSDHRINYVNSFPDITQIIDQKYRNKQIEEKQSFSETKKLKKNSKGIQRQKWVLKDYSIIVDPTDQNIEHPIKTFRYFNKQFKRLYFDDLLEQHSQYDYQQKMADLQAKLSLKKMQNPQQQQRVTKAINTYIYHPEIIRLLVSGFIFLIIAITIHFVTYSYFIQNIQNASDTISVMQQNVQNVKIVILALSQLLFNGQLSNSTTYTLQNKQMQYFPVGDTATTVYNFSIFSNSTFKQISIINSLMLMQTNILIQNETTSKQLITWSYLTSVMNYLRSQYLKNDQLNNDTHLAPLFIVLMLIFCLCFGVMWVYQSLLIKYKTYAILLMFLDIPFDFIRLSEKQCVLFARSCQKAEKIQSAASLQEWKIQVQTHQYEVKHQDEQNSEGQEEGKLQNNKNRQILISRHKKKGIMGLFEYFQLAKVASVVICLTLLIVLVFVNGEIWKQASVVYQNIISYSQAYTELHNIPIILKIIYEKSQNSSTWQLFTSAKLKSLKNVTFVNLRQIQKQNALIELIYLNQDLTQNFFKLEYADLCNNFANKSATYCGTLIDGRLKGGYSVIIEYVLTMDQSPQLTQIAQLQQGLRQYASPILFKTLSTLSEQTVASIDKTTSYLKIFFYVWMTVMIAVMLIPWNIYLIKTNLLINQTIQILNVVPMSLLPMQRKETRDFVKWIIYKAGQHQS